MVKFLLAFSILSVCPSVCLYIYMFVCLSVCIYLSVCLSVCLCIYISIYVCLSVCQYLVPGKIDIASPEVTNNRSDVVFLVHLFTFSE